MLNFLKNLAARNGDQGNILDSHFNIPLNLTPEFDVGIFNYIYRMESKAVNVYLPDVALSIDGDVLRPNNGMYTIKPGLVKINYNGQVYTIVFLRS